MDVGHFKRRIPNPELRLARELRCWSQEDVAERIGTSAFTVCRWERGVTTPSPHFRQKLCMLFERTAEGLGFVSIGSARQDAPSRPVTIKEWRVGEAESVTRRHFVVPPLFPVEGLIGRDTIFAALRRQVLAHKRVALHGLPGVGKTALAVAIAHDPEVVREFSDGVLWVSVGPEPDAPTLLAGLAAALGVAPIRASEGTSPHAMAKSLSEAIGARRLLLIIDDAWKLDDVLLFALGSPGSSHVLTTRFPQVASYFASDECLRVDELDEAQAMELLSRIAPRVAEEESQAAHALVQSVGGLPLALLLAGRYLRAQGYSGQPRRTREALWRLRHAEERLRISDPSSFIHSPSYFPVGESASLETVIAISDHHLNDEAGTALRALSLFPAKPNSFSEEAALALSDSSVSVLDSLTDAGLLESYGPARYALHQTIADYARVRLEDDGVQVRLVTYYMQFIQTHETDYAVLEREIANICTALDLAHARELSGDLIRGATAFAPFLLARGFYALAELHLCRAARSAGVPECEAYLPRVYLYLGRVAELRGRLAEAGSWYDNGLSVARKIDDAVSSLLLAHKGETLINQGDYVHAEPYLLEGVQLARACGDRRSQATLLRLLGEVMDCRDQFARGDQFYLQGLRLAREINDSEATSCLLQNLGEKATKYGNYGRALGYLTEGLQLARAIHHRQRISACLTDLGALACKRGYYRQAEIYAREALQVARTIGHPIRLVNALCISGEVASCKKLFTEAERHLQEGLLLARDIRHPFLLAECLCLLGELRLRQDNAEQAEVMFREAYAIAEEVCVDEMRASALYGLARTAACRGNLVEAHDQGDRSLVLFAAEGHKLAGEIARWLTMLPAGVRVDGRAHPHGQGSLVRPSRVGLRQVSPKMT
jgi:tetratricopeptide (TPR) repeat protein/transcriptional regulator with XRE-family HTH domain